MLLSGPYRGRSRKNTIVRIVEVNRHIPNEHYKGLNTIDDSTPLLFIEYGRASCKTCKKRRFIPAARDSDTEVCARTLRS